MPSRPGEPFDVAVMSPEGSNDKPQALRLAAVGAVEDVHGAGQPVGVNSTSTDHGRSVDSLGMQTCKYCGGKGYVAKPITVGDAARALGISYSMVRYWILAGKMQAAQMGKARWWYIPKAEVERWLTIRAHPNGRRLRSSVR